MSGIADIDHTDIDWSDKDSGCTAGIHWDFAAESSGRSAVAPAEAADN